MHGREPLPPVGRVTAKSIVSPNSLAPTVAGDGPFRLFLFSHEESRMHIHVAHPDGEAKFRLEPGVTR